jgi:hypothetical protein
VGDGRNHPVTQIESSAAVLAGQVRNLSFAVSTLTERLPDSSPSVVLEVLKLEDKALNAVVDSYFGRQSPMLRAIAGQLADLQDLEPDDRKLPDRIYNLLEQDAPFAAEDMIVRLLERIIDDMGRPVTRPLLCWGEF